MFNENDQSSIDQDKLDHRSYTHNLSSCEIKTERKKGIGRTRANIFLGQSERPKNIGTDLFFFNFPVAHKATRQGFV